MRTASTSTSTAPASPSRRATPKATPAARPSPVPRPARSARRASVEALAEAVAEGPRSVPNAGLDFSLTAANIATASQSQLREILKEADAYNGVYKLKTPELRAYAQKVLEVRDSGWNAGLTGMNVDCALDEIRKTRPVLPEPVAAPVEAPPAPSVEAPAPPVAVQTVKAARVLKAPKVAPAEAPPAPAVAVAPEGRLAALIDSARSGMMLTPAERIEVERLFPFPGGKADGNSYYSVWYTKGNALVGIREASVAGQWEAVNLFTSASVVGDYGTALKAARAWKK